MARIKKMRIILRNDTSDNWDKHGDKVLFKGELGIEFNDDDTVKGIKIGDGVSTWDQLGYFAGNGSGGGSIDPADLDARIAKSIENYMKEHADIPDDEVEDLLE